MFVKIIDGEAVDYTINQLKKDNKNVSFPKNIDNDVLASFGVYPAVIADQPSFNNKTHGASLNDTPTEVDGVWTYNWTITEYTQSELDAGEAALAADIRELRDSKLVETDFYALSDVTMSDEMPAYRQALRDITAHSNFPNDLTDDDWPTKPQIDWRKPNEQGKRFSKPNSFRKHIS